MIASKSPANGQAFGLNHSSRGQRPRKTPPHSFRPVRAIQKRTICPIAWVSVGRLRYHSTIRLAPLRRDTRVLREILHQNRKPSSTAIFLFKLFQGVPRRSKPFQAFFRKKRLFIFYAPPQNPDPRTSSSCIGPLRPIPSHQSVFIRVHPWLKTLQKSEESHQKPTATLQKTYLVPPLTNVKVITTDPAIFPLPAGEGKGEGESSKPEPVSIHFALNTASKYESTRLNRWPFLPLRNSMQTHATPGGGY
jgi:hypothetical protein